MTYRLLQLAAGSYDVEHEGEIIASLVQTPSHGAWIVELLDVRPDYPPPFTQPLHRFDKRADALRWLGEPELVAVPRAGASKRKRS